MKALVGAFNQEKALVGAFSVIVQPVVEPMEHYTALVSSTTLFTLHRRLGPLGFLSLGTSEVPGNAGMLDQVAALSWVQVGHCCCLSSAQLCLELQTMVCEDFTITEKASSWLLAFSHLRHYYAKH